MGAEEGTIESIPGHERRIAQAWVNVRGGLRIFWVYFWHLEGWTPRNEDIMEAVLNRAGTTKHPWLIACDADFEKKPLVSERSNACHSSSRGVDVQIKKTPKENGWKMYMTMS